MEFVTMNFTISCPHCSNEITIETDITANEFPNGQFAHQCEECFNLFACHYSITAECSVYKCDKEKSKTTVFCSFGDADTGEEVEA